MNGTPARPLSSVDVAVFAVIDDALKVLLVQRPAAAKDEPYPGLWALPGGFVDVARDADLQACARRKLREKTGVASPYLEQLGSWGSARRDPRGWSATHVFFALIPAPALAPNQGGNAAGVGWVDIDRALRRKLAFDHADILRSAVERLRAKVEYTSLPAYLLPEPFTLPQLQRCYETVLGRSVDKSGFRTRMMAAGFLEEVGVVEGSGSRRPPMGYRLKDRSPVNFPRSFGPQRPP